jgi:hypothetical protein
MPKLRSVKSVDTKGSRRLEVRGLPDIWHTSVEIDAKLVGKTKEDYCYDILMDYQRRTIENLERAMHVPE